MLDINGILWSCSKLFNLNLKAVLYSLILFPVNMTISADDLRESSQLDT